MFYNDAAPLALESGITWIGNFGGRFGRREAWGMRCEAGRNGFSDAGAQAANARGWRRGVVVKGPTNNERKPRRGAIKGCALPGRCRPYGAKDLIMGGCSTTMPRRWRWSPMPRGLEILEAVWEARGVGHKV